MRTDPTGPVVLAGGGTVGHLAPGFAVRDALADLGVEAVFVTPGEAREAGWFPEGEPPPLHAPAARLPRGAIEKVAFPFRMARAVLAARRLLARLRPRAVLALGGWPCAPTAIAALTRGIPLHLVATDAVPGIVVRRLGRRAARVYVTRPQALAALPDPSKGLLVAPVVRRAVATAVRDPARFGLDPARRTLFVVGGSLGAKGLNERAREGLRAALRSDGGLRERLQVIHSAGTEEEAAAARADYEALSLRHFTVPFLRDVGTALRTADLVLCRGGAGTLAEVEALARPAVVVPYPHHADRQQFLNAEPLVARGAAVLVEEAALDPETFSREVLGLLFDPARLARMAAAKAPAPSGPSGIDSVVGEDSAATIARELVRSIRDAGGGT